METSSPSSTNPTASVLHKEHCTYSLIRGIHTPKKMNKDELIKLVYSLADAIGSLQTQNIALIETVGELQKTISDMKKKVDLCPTTNSFAEIVKKGLTAPTAQVSMLRAAELAQNSDVRKAAVIIRNADVSSDVNLDNEIGKLISSACEVDDHPEVFRIHLKNDAPPLLKLQFKSKSSAEKVLNSFNKIKDKVHGCRKSAARPDLSKPELLKYRMAWKEAILKNNEAAQRIYTVRNLEVVKIVYKEGTTPWPWTVKNPK